MSLRRMKSALKQMHPIKAPEPDGMSAVFFFKNTGILSVLVALNVLNSYMPIAEINKTNITLN